MIISMMLLWTMMINDDRIIHTEDLLENVCASC